MKKLFAFVLAVVMLAAVAYAATAAATPAPEKDPAPEDGPKYQADVKPGDSVNIDAIDGVDNDKITVNAGNNNTTVNNGDNNGEDADTNEDTTTEPAEPATPAEEDESNPETGGGNGTTTPETPANPDKDPAPEGGPKWQSDVKPGDSITIDAMGDINNDNVTVWAGNNNVTIQIG